MDVNVNSDLYDFLKEREIGLYREGNNVYAYVHVRFMDLEEFSNIVGRHHFDEGGIQVTMFDETICIELNDIIENDGDNLLSYSKCFSPSLIQEYLPDLKKKYV